MSRYSRDDYKECAICGKRYKDHSLVRCEPATELELRRIRRARETGKCKNPSWYKVPALPKRTKPDLRQKYPSYVMAFFTRQSDPFLEWKLPEAAESTVQYVREFNRLNNLIPVPIVLGGPL